MRYRECYCLIVFAAFSFMISLSQQGHAQDKAKTDNSHLLRQNWGVGMQPDVSGREYKDPGIALRKALLHTGVPVGAGILLSDSEIIDNRLINTTGAILIGYGLFYGPSNGNFYAEDHSRGMTGLGVRVGSFGLVLGYALAVLPNAYVNAFSRDNDRDYTGYNVVVALSTLTFTGSLIYNIATAPKSAREYNKDYNLDLSLGMEHMKYIQKTAPVLRARISF